MLFQASIIFLFLLEVKYRKAYIQALTKVMSMDDAAEVIHIDMIADRYAYAASLEYAEILGMRYGL